MASKKRNESSSDESISTDPENFGQSSISETLNKNLSLDNTEQGSYSLMLGSISYGSSVEDYYEGFLKALEQMENISSFELNFSYHKEEVPTFNATQCTSTPKNNNEGCISSSLSEYFMDTSENTSCSKSPEQLPLNIPPIHETQNSNEEDETSDNKDSLVAGSSKIFPKGKNKGCDASMIKIEYTERSLASWNVPCRRCLTLLHQHNLQLTRYLENSSKIDHTS